MDCAGQVDSLGYNLIGNTNGCTFVSSSGDRSGNAASPLLARVSPLPAAGDHTRVLELLPGSPAVDRGGPSCVLRDQRGVLRPIGGACDMGSAERAPEQPAEIVLLKLSNNATT